MPNHVYNVMKISGPLKELKAFKDFAEGKNPWSQQEQELCCAKFIPPPQTAIDDYNDFGYDFCRKEWGTKWGCYNVQVELYKRSLIYWFDSAWSPPCPVVKVMSKKFKTLLFNLHYRECGMCFQGWLKCKGGEVLLDKKADYHGKEGG